MLERSLVQEAELSARNVAHRRDRAFQDVVRKSSGVLKKALAGSTAAAATGSSSSAIIVQDATASASMSTRRVSTQFQRAYAFQRLQQFESAVRDYNECAMQEPTHALVFYNRGCALYALHRKEEAVCDFSKAIKLEANNMLYIESRAIVLKEVGRFHEAIHDYVCLEALRRMANKPASTSTNEVNSTTPAGHHAHHGSFSASFGDFNLSFQSGTPATGAILTSAAGGEKESRVCDWFLRFLKQKPVSRTSSDLKEAVAYAKTWSFFRGMAKEMVEQCLEEATYGNFEADQVVVDQGVHSQSFHVILNTVASLVKNVDAHGVSKVRELKTLCQGDTVGLEPFGYSFADGTLRTLKHVVVIPPRSSARSSHSGGMISPHSSSALPMTTHHARGGATPGSGSSGKPLRTDDHEREEGVGGDGEEDGALLTLEPASFTCLDDVHCLVLSAEVYRSILHEHEENDLDERVQFLRSCRVFQSCSEDVVTSLGALSSRKVYDPGKDILRAGDIVTQLCLIKRGVCQVRKTITMSKPSSVPRKAHRHSPNSLLATSEDVLTSRSNDGSWVLDNGWMLTNPRLVNNAQNGGKCEKMVTEEVNVAILASGQMFGELSVLQPGHPSQVTIRTQTLVEILVFKEADLAMLNVQFQSGTMNALQDSLLFHNPPQQKIIQLHRELDSWEKEKRGVLEELYSNSALSLSKCGQQGLSLRAAPSPILQRGLKEAARKGFKLSPLEKDLQRSLTGLGRSVEGAKSTPLLPDTHR